METLKAGLAKVKGEKSPGVDGKTKADISPERLLKLQKYLKVQKYQPKPNKRVPIPKLGGGTRYLGIASTIDKVVQGAILVLLEPLVDPMFLDCSYGFRPNRSTHMALKEIKLK